MAYNEKLAERVRSSLSSRSEVQEKKMMGGLTFMVNDKMCLGVLNDDLMARIDPDQYEPALQRPGCRAMDLTGRPMKGFVFVGGDGTEKKRDLDYWIGLALEFNQKAMPSKKRR